VLVDSSGVTTQSVNHIPGLDSPIALPFEKELAELLAPLAASPLAAPTVPHTGFYFLEGLSVPGQAHASGAGVDGAAR